MHKICATYEPCSHDQRGQRLPEGRDSQALQLLLLLLCTVTLLAAVTQLWLNKKT